MRRATTHDTDEIVRVVNAAYRVEHFFLRGDRIDADDVRARLSSEHGHFAVADGSPGTLAGAVYIETHNERGYFALLAVDPRQQGKGLGRALVEHAIEHCRTAGCAFVEIEIVDIRLELPAFYARFDFKPVRTEPFPKPQRLIRPALLVVQRKTL